MVFAGGEQVEQGGSYVVIPRGIRAELIFPGRWGRR